MLTGVLVELGDGHGDDGRDRQLPAVGEGVGAAGRDRRMRRRSCRPGRCGELVADRATATRSRCRCSENQMLFGMDGVWLSARRIDGQFPNYRQLLPQTFEHEVAICRGGAAGRDPAHLADGPAQPAAAADASSRGALTVARPDPGRRRGPRVAAGAISTASGWRSGSTPDFLRDGVESVEGDTVRLKLISSLRPGLLQGEDGSLLVPDHADPAAPPDRRRSARGARCGAADFRCYERLDGRAAGRPGRSGRAQRRRQDRRCSR